MYKEKTEMMEQKPSFNETKQAFFKLIKTGIVNSNLIATFTGLWLALALLHQSILEQLPLVFYTLIGSALVVAGSCSLNNYIDRDIDHLMERTKNRPTVTGFFTPSFALYTGVFLVLIGLFFLTLTTLMATLMAFLGFVGYVFFYTKWTKRHTWWNTVVGSFSGAMPPLIGWAAVDPHLHQLAGMLFLLMFIWQPPHFYAIAIRRVEEYAKANVPMLPVVKGFSTTKRHIRWWIVALLPIPFFMKELGNVFTVFMTCVTLGWLVLSFATKRAGSETKWATWMFIYSIIYFLFIFGGMILVPLLS